MNALSKNSFSETGFNPFYSKSVSDEGQYFSDYLAILGLLGEPRLLVLSLRRNYYFDFNILKDLKVLVILRKLDHIEHLVDFLRIICRILPAEACFIGCFDETHDSSAGANPYYHSISSYDRFVSYCESKYHIPLHKKTPQEIIESFGFRLFNKTSISRQVYFACSNSKCL